jgi:ectoine hydroxylase-related dioxygenase (phytanoyl-CoA dioxygenase family)
MAGNDIGEMFEANGLLGDKPRLRSRMESDGYLFFRGVIPTAKLKELKNDLTLILADQGWIKGGAQRMAAEAASLPHREGEALYLDALDQIVKLESLHSLAHEKNLLQVMRQVLGDSAFPHPLSIVRLVFPHAPELTTPPHQDYPNNQGTKRLTAAWIPLDDCVKADGSLAIMEGSNQFGVLPLKFHLGAGNRGASLTQEMSDCRWVGADFKAGDVLLFGAMTVHRSLDNHNFSRMRLSVDFRYQLEAEELTAGSLKPHFGRVSWDEIYKDWKSKKHQYYWRDKNYVTVPWDQSLQDLPEGHLASALRQEIQYSKAVKGRYDLHSVEKNER